jgi:hypothetical protein
MFLIEWATSALSWIWDKLTTDDEERVENAYRRVESALVDTPAMRNWLERSGWKATGGDVVAAMRNPLTRDAATYGALNVFYETGDDPAKMMAQFTERGLNNGTTTRAYLINHGDDSLGKSDSNHQGALLVDESAAPPRITLVMRGMNPTRDWFSPVSGIWNALLGRSSTECQAQADQFWQGAQGDITRVMNEVAARHPGAAPEITIAGHSYGSDAAARLIPKFAQSFPQYQGQLNLVGYGATRSFTSAERDQIMAILGNDDNRARQYMTRNDWIKTGLGHVVGRERDIPIDAGHLGYDKAGDVQAVLAAVREQLTANPDAAEARARELVEQYRSNPDATLASLAAYAAAPPSGSIPAAPGATRAVV